MKRFTFIAAIFILVVSIFFIIIQENQPENSAANAIQAAFYTTGAKVVTSEIYMRGRLRTQDCDSRQERRNLLSAVISSSGGNTDTIRPIFSEIDTDDSVGTQLDYIIDDDNSIHASVLSERKNGSINESWVTVSLVNTAQKQELRAAAASLESALKKYSAAISTNICITGSKEGELDNTEVNAICDKILESTGASRIEGLQDKDLVSVSAFSPSMGNAVRVNGRRINLNVAVRYNSYEGKTYIWLASPVITTEY